MRWKTFFSVTGTLTFPIDMLRYDACWPVTQQDVAAMSIALDGAHVRRAEGPQTVLLCTYSRDKSAAGKPTVARWASFGWRVENVRMEKI